MRIKTTENGLIITDENDTGTEEYSVMTGENGKKYVARNTVSSHYLNISEGNSKTGEKCINFNLSIEYSCNHNIECYQKAKCYAEGGCYTFANNQKKYSENVNFFLSESKETFIQAIQMAIDSFGFNHFRFFTCGDILNSKFFECMIEIALKNPHIKFWSYTKKYAIVNKWIDKNGDLPENLKIVFSHWMNEDGTYYPMENPHNLPTSEFIPFGKENLIDKSYHICPCSDPTVKATCLTCDHPCYDLKKGEHMALLEHSTKQTKERDKMIKQAKANL